jgi:homeodomain-containing protein
LWLIFAALKRGLNLDKSCQKKHHRMRLAGWIDADVRVLVGIPMAVWRWQERFMSEGVDGLLRDKTRPARIARLTDDVDERIVALTLGEPPGETTHWTGRVMAKRPRASA